MDYHSLAVRKKRNPNLGGARPGAGRKRIVLDPVRVSTDHEREDFEAIQAMAEARGTSVAELVRAAVRAYVRRYGRR